MNFPHARSKNMLAQHISTPAPVKTRVARANFMPARRDYYVAQQFFGAARVQSSRALLNFMNLLPLPCPRYSVHQFLFKAGAGTPFKKLLKASLTSMGSSISF